MRHLLMTLLIVGCFEGTTQAVTLGQIDTFTDGVQNWGAYGSRLHMSDGGPEGDGDGFLAVLAHGGTDLRGELIALSPYPRWSGNYADGVITALAMDLKNFGDMPLEMRLHCIHNLGRVTSINAFPIPADGQWHRTECSVQADALISDGDLLGLLQDTRFSIRHQSGPPRLESGAEKIFSAFGLDNVTAVPEPISAVLLGLGGICVTRRNICK